jgi:Flp pilus assembly pilin Flp
MNLRRRFVALKEEFGQDMVEYSLLLGFVGLVSIGILNRFQGQIKGFFSLLSSTLPT